ncbi:MAG: FAD-binding oxidoreductase [Flavobacteriales bacterium]|nr:FAD-binding oxidoreductase [Flavobacteriales bacterium]
MRETENLIVGLGIAGINLCHQLEKTGKSFLVVDNCPTNSASLIAGGIYNPVVFKRKLKSWKADELVPSLVESYTELDERLGINSLLHPFPILKPISSKDEVHEWHQVIAEGRLSPFVESIEERKPTGPFTDEVIASVTIKSAGFVRIENLLLAYRKYLKQKGFLIKKALDYSKLKLKESEIEYEDVKAERIIFSEGRYISENPFFNWVPFKPTKGQILTVKAHDSLSADRIYNQQFLLFPTEEKNIFKLGATYEWNVLDEVPTKEATEELLSKAKKTLNVSFEVVEEKAAIRPTVVDRRPVIGVHPEHKYLFLFNGMGTKGVMIAPYFAKQLVDFIYNDGELDAEANLNRFLRRHYKKD